MRFHFIYLQLIIYATLLCSCGEEIVMDKYIPTTDTATNKIAKRLNWINDTIIVVAGDSVDIKFSAKKNKGTILILPGWNYNRKKCCNESSFCTKALAMGYNLVLPEMGKSIYASNTFPETRKDWLKYPQLKWLTDTLIPYLQKKAGLLNSDNPNFLFGISTGARGVVAVAENTTNIFIAGAALSGDYDQTLLPNDNLMKGMYGDYEKFPERWKGSDNLSLNASKVEIPLYLGHGADDKVVPTNQTTLFYNALVDTKKEITHQLKIASKQAHDYHYWDSETDAILGFFEKQRQ